MGVGGSHGDRLQPPPTPSPHCAEWRQQRAGGQGLGGVGRGACWAAGGSALPERNDRPPPLPDHCAHHQLRRVMGPRATATVPLRRARRSGAQLPFFVRCVTPCFLGTWSVGSAQVNGRLRVGQVSGVGPGGGGHWGTGAAITRAAGVEPPRARHETRRAGATPLPFPLPLSHSPSHLAPTGQSDATSSPRGRGRKQHRRHTEPGPSGSRPFSSWRRGEGSTTGGNHAGGARAGAPSPPPPVCPASV